MTEMLAQRFDWFGKAVTAGVDEAGRGPLAGPVVAAAVILDDRKPIAGLRDSKMLSEIQRLELAREIRLKARAFAIAYAGHAEIDTLNILQASLLAMERAVAKLTTTPELVLVDGNQLPAFSGGAARYLLEPVIRGDETVPSISAASILAKVCRDRLMRRLNRAFPGYGFDRNKGYPTRAHIDGLRKLGPCAIHRTTYAPVKAAGIELGA